MREESTGYKERQRYSPLGRLSASDIRRGLLRLLTQPSSAVGVLFSNRLAIGQVLSSVDDQNEGADLGAINAHVRENAGRVHSIERVWDFGLGRHDADSSIVACVSRLRIGVCRVRSRQRDAGRVNKERTGGQAGGQLSSKNCTETPKLGMLTTPIGHSVDFSAALLISTRTSAQHNNMPLRNEQLNTT